MVANNISPEKESSEESDLSDHCSSMDINENNVNNEIDKKLFLNLTLKKKSKKHSLKIQINVLQ